MAHEQDSSKDVVIVEEVLVAALEGSQVIVNEVQDRIFGPGSLGIGPNVSVPDRPYIAYNELPDAVAEEVQETSDARLRAFAIYVYDERGDFTRINRILSEIRRIVKGMAPFTTADGIRCSQSRWAGISGDIHDDGYDSGAKFGTAEFMVSG